MVEGRDRETKPSFEMGLEKGKVIGGRKMRLVRWAGDHDVPGVGDALKSAEGAIIPRIKLRGRGMVPLARRRENGKATGNGGRRNMDVL